MHKTWLTCHHDFTDIIVLDQVSDDFLQTQIAFANEKSASFILVAQEISAWERSLVTMPAENKRDD